LAARLESSRKVQTNAKPLWAKAIQYLFYLFEKPPVVKLGFVVRYAVANAPYKVNP
jgi:hypothetical protein